MDEQDLAAAIIEELERRGVPEGTWLVEIDQARAMLKFVDAMLLRLHNAILSQAAANRDVP